MQIRREVQEQSELLRQIRRNLHKRPELGLQEKETRDFVCGFLKDLKPDQLVLLDPTGVKAVFLAPEAKETIALRADMDALPFTEETDVPWKSEIRGVMHACGHDAHMAMALVTAKIVAEERRKLNRNIVFVFQPGEESLGGAHILIDGGVLENPKPDAVYGMHVWPGLPVGKLGFHEGVFMTRNHGFDIRFLGKSSHAANPEAGHDAILAASEAILRFADYRERMVQKGRSIILHTGMIQGGKRRNIVADDVTVACSLRTFEEETYKDAEREIKAILDDIRARRKVEAITSVVQDYPPVYNDPALTRRTASLMDDGATELPRQLISEDFAFYEQIVPGTFWLLGIEREEALHSSKLIFDEEPLLYGIEAFLRICFA